MSIIGWIIIGGLAGWIAEKFMKADHSILTNIALGILGALVGGWISGILNIDLGDGVIASLITAAAGACLLIYLYRMVRSRQQRQNDTRMPPPRDDDFTGMN